MRDARDDARLLDEPIGGRRIAARAIEHLDGDALLDLRLKRRIHDPHTAAPERAGHDVGADGGPTRQILETLALHSPIVSRALASPAVAQIAQARIAQALQPRRSF